jgi:N-acetylmuramoyl-L-alanine amidase
MKHVVRKGECLSSIARKYGLGSWRDIYDLPANSAMRAKRPNPNVIYPGDEFEIPAKASKTATASTGGRKSFTASFGKVELHLRLRDALGSTLQNAKYELRIAPAAPVKGTLDGAGALVAALSADAKRARVEVQLPAPTAAAAPPPDGLDLPAETFTVPDEPVDSIAEAAPPTALVCELDLGALDPVFEATGVRERLHNLGYLADVGDAGAATGALKAFQEDKGMSPTGVLDATVRQKLQQAHDGAGP